MNNHKGFTIIELLVVVGLIVIFLVLIFSNFGATRARTRDNIRIADVQRIRLALEEYKSFCGEYPSRLDLDTNNGDCPEGFSLEDLINEIPENESYTQGPGLSGINSGDLFNGYLYAGLSTRSEGPCFNYHLGVQLESGWSDETNSYRLGETLQEDHDCRRDTDLYDVQCAGSEIDFQNADRDEDYGIYDFRSANTCSL